MSKKGEALTIISLNDDTKNFKLDEAALKRLLFRDDVKDKPVCVVAVAGAFRQGKSFLLNYFLRYCASQSKENWMGSPSDPLEGFSWVKSPHRETTGIVVWSEPFIVKLGSGEEIAILVMDTQGTFDTKSSLKESTMVFALTLLVSSVVVYNLMGKIQEDDLMNLDAFIQYGLLAQEGSDKATAFQKILFLVRDWIHPDDFAYGAQGGLQYLDDILEFKEDQDPAHQDLRHNLSKCFSDIGCYLMPEPGKIANKSKDFDGRYSELDAEFVEYLQKLVPLLLAPENIEKRTLAGQTIKTEDLFNSFKIYMEIFNSKDLPDLVSVADGILKARCEAAKKEAKKLYENGMKEVIEEDHVLSQKNLDALHSSLYQSALELFQSYGINERISSSYERQLEEDLTSLHEQFTKENELKRSKQFYKRVAIGAGGVAAAVGGVAAVVAAPAIAAVAGAAAAVDALPGIGVAVAGSVAVAGAAVGYVRAVAASRVNASVGGAAAAARFVVAVGSSSASALVGGAAAAVDALPVIAAGVRGILEGLHSIVRYATSQNSRSNTQSEKKTKTSCSPKTSRRHESPQLCAPERPQTKDSL